MRTIDSTLTSLLIRVIKLPAEQREQGIGSRAEIFLLEEVLAQAIPRPQSLVRG
jgi:hypothetical protein